VLNQIAKISTPARILYLCCFVVLIGCQPSSEKEPEGRIDTIKETENGYTRIALSLCDEVYKHTYTDSNTTFFWLDLTNDSSCFVFVSDLVCGAPMGSCGQNIQVIQHTENGYQVVFETCGSKVSESREANYGLLNFYYETREGLRYKVFYNEKNFEEKTISLNNLDFAKIRIIASKLGQDYRSFTPETQTDRDWESNKVVIEKVQVGPSAFAELYTVKMAPTQQFWFYNDSLVLHLNEVLSFEVLSRSSQKMYDIKTYNSDSYAMTRDTSYYVPIFYEYSARKKVYEKVVD
jgi:hypothetical protein